MGKVKGPAPKITCNTLGELSYLRHYHANLIRFLCWKRNVLLCALFCKKNMAPLVLTYIRFSGPLGPREAYIGKTALPYFRTIEFMGNNWITKFPMSTDLDSNPRSLARTTSVQRSFLYRFYTSEAFNFIQRNFRSWFSMIRPKTYK